MTSRSSTQASNSSRPAHWANSSGTLFKNPWPSAEEPTWTELYKGTSPISWYAPGHADTPDIKVVKPDWGTSALKAKFPNTTPAGYLIGTWLGHAGSYVEIPSLDQKLGTEAKGGLKESIYLVFDPIFSYRAGPTQYTGPARYREPPCQIADLPGCDIVFISHNHYDHLDTGSITSILKSFPETLWFVPLGNKKWMLETGAKNDKIVELDWWEDWAAEIKGKQLVNGTKSLSTTTAEGKTSLKVTCVPAQHNSGRSTFDKDKTLWCGWVIERFAVSSRKGSIYHAGDTGYRRMKHSPVVCPAFKQIGDKFGGFDLSWIPIWRGGTLGFISYFGLKLHQNAIPAAHHVYPADAIEVHKDVKSRNSIGVHYGTFVGSEAESREAVKEYADACMRQGVASLEDVRESGNGRAGLLDTGASVVVEMQT